MISLCLILSFGFVIPEVSDLELDICQFIEQNRSKILRETGFSTDAVQWGAITNIYKNSTAKYSAWLEDGIQYIYYGASDGPPIKVCYSRISDKNLKCSKADRRVLISFNVSKPGEYFVYVKGVSSQRGQQVSYLTYLYKGNSKHPKYQDQYE